MKAKDVLTKGLAAGYAGGKPTSVNRAGFDGSQSDHDFGSGEKYHDEWFAHEKGGGQELARGDDGTLTRVYAGGTVNKNILEHLGITDQDVVKFFITSLVKHSGQARLDKDCLPESEGDWQYSYEVLENIPEFELTLGKETITYKGKEVFIHFHLITPVK